jgi:hypothetical protein
MDKLSTYRGVISEGLVGATYTHHLHDGVKGREVPPNLPWPASVAGCQRWRSAQVIGSE